MKKTTLLLCLFLASVLMPQSVWADDSSWGISDTTLTVTSVQAGYLNGLQKTNEMKACKRVVLIGEFNESDLSSIQLNGNDFNFKVVDVSQATFPMQGNITYKAYKDSKPENDNYQGFRVVEGGTLYVASSNYMVVKSTLDASQSWNDVQSDWWESDIESNLRNNNNSVGYFKIKEDKYYHKGATNWELIEKSNIPAESAIDNKDWQESDMSSKPLNESNKDYVRIHGNNYAYYHAYNSNATWSVVESYGNSGVDVLGNFANTSNLPIEVAINSHAVVGGTVYMGKWVDNNFSWTLVTPMNSKDWTAIKFSKWANSIETAILPDGIEAVYLDQNSLWKNPTCDYITKVQSGTTIATLRREGNNTFADLNVASNSEEFARMKDILKMNSYVDESRMSSSMGEEGYNENTKKYTVQGALDCSVINGFEGDLKVLDLKNATGVDKTTLSQLTKSTIEYIILPGGKDKAFVCDSSTYYKGATNPKTKNISSLKAVISAQSTNLVAHLVEAGNLAKARCYATGVKEANTFKPTVMHLTSVTLSGSLNASDISTHDEDKGLSGENSTITKMDLEKAYFADYNDMKFEAAGFRGQSNECVLKDITLPACPRMTDIPKDCFRNMKSLDSLCIPFNYKHLHNGALYDSNVEHLTTTDSIGGAVIDNGMYTYTLSANIEELGDAPSPKLNGDGKPNGTEIYVFPKENGVTEIYSLATKVPKCYKDVFSFDVTFGYGGQDESKVYCRDRFFNNGEREKSFVVLRYPSEEVFNRRKKKGKPVEASYALMEKKYTDVTKDYTKKDQTGAVDANGNPLLWPSRTEMNRSYNQASVGALWNDWPKSYTGSNNSEINFDEDPVNNVNNGNGNGGSSRRFDPVDPSILPIDLTQGMTQYVERTVDGDRTYTFTPTADVQNMFQYMPYAVDNKTYNKIVIEFAQPVPEGFFIHHYGEHGTYYSLKGLTRYEFALTGPTIDDFTIFNWDGYWGDGFEYVAQQDRRNIKISRAYLTSDEVAAPVTTSKYGHESDITPDFIDYMGWHQIVLTQAAYYEPVEKEVENDVVTRRYEDAGWFTFCIPYDMTYSQVVKMMGVPKSTGKVKNLLGEVEQGADIMPDIRQLNSVVRTKAANDKENNSVVFRLTTDLAVQGKKTAKYLDFAQSGENMTTMSTKYASNKSTDAPETPGANVDPVCLIGCRPYIIKAYKRVGETIAERNLGKYILTHYSDEFSESASYANDGEDYYEQLYTYKQESSGDGAKSASVVVDKQDELTMRFAKPYERHKVQAFDGSENGGQLVFDTIKVDGKTHATQRFYYTMVGQFWEQDLPQYCVYLSQGQAWKRYAKTDLNFKWDPYKCVIMCTPEIVDRDYVTTDNIENSLKPDAATQTKITAELKENKQTIFDTPQNYATDFNRFGGGFRDISKCYFPMNFVGTKDWIPAPMTLWFFGRNDYYFGNQSVPQANSTRYILTIDNEDEIIEYGEEVTNVKAIDTLDGVPQLTGKSRVYNLSGQYMGNTTDGLSRGVYIVDGRKIVVE